MIEGLAADPPDEPAAPPAAGYLDLLKRTLTGMVYEDPPIPASWLGYKEYRERERAMGFDWPQHAPCMIGLDKLANVQECAEQVLMGGVPGDFAEAGVWRGGTCIFMRALLGHYGDHGRNVWVIDSFQGLPPGQAEDTGFEWDAPEQEALAVSAAEVRHNFALYGLDDDRVKLLEGWFADTLPGAPIGQLAILRIDGDLYESQRDALHWLYPKLSPGGYCIIDDPHFPGVARAIREYRHQHRIAAPIYTAGPWCLYWRKP